MFAAPSKLNIALVAKHHQIAVRGCITAHSQVNVCTFAASAVPRYARYATDALLVSIKGMCPYFVIILEVGDHSSLGKYDEA